MGKWPDAEENERGQHPFCLQRRWPGRSISCLNLNEPRDADNLDRSDSLHLSPDPSSYRFLFASQRKAAAIRGNCLPRR